LAATSIIGTVIPQNENPAKYVQAFGEFLYRLFQVLDFFDMYHSWWFQLLLLLLTLNIVICSLDRLSATWKIVFVKNPHFNASRFRKLSDKEEFTANNSPDDLKKIYEPVISGSFRYNRIEQTRKGFCIFGEKGRWTRLGVYAVHLSVILLLAGALIGSVSGFEGYVNIPEGEAVNSILIRKTRQMRNLDFEIRCDDFDVSFYNSGAPKEYRSTLTVLEKGKPVLTKNIIVNDPLRYKGINLFQSSYGPIPPEDATLNFASKKTGKVYKKTAKIGQQIDLPEAMGTFLIKAYRESADFRGHNMGEAFLGTLTPKSGNPVFVLLPLRYPSFDKMRKGRVSISIAGFNRRYYTGLQVTKDPGVWVVYSGFMMIIIGIFITFFMAHRQICIEVTKSGNKSRVMVAGTATKNRQGIQRKVKNISESLINLGQRG